jgi:hypothetical protein
VTTATENIRRRGRGRLEPSPLHAKWKKRIQKPATCTCIIIDIFIAAWSKEQSQTSMLRRKLFQLVSKSFQ